jgi:hypothetical protein
LRKPLFSPCVSPSSSPWKADLPEPPDRSAMRIGPGERSALVGKHEPAGFAALARPPGDVGEDAGGFVDLEALFDRRGGACADAGGDRSAAGVRGARSAKGGKGAKSVKGSACKAGLVNCRQMPKKPPAPSVAPLDNLFQQVLEEVVQQ